MRPHSPPIRVHPILGLAVSLMLLGLAASTGEAVKQRPPNLVLIVADDLGWNDVGFHGSEIKTPVLDRMAREGVELQRFYVYPTCSPTRACLLTGRNASRFGIPGPISITSKRAVPLDTKTLAEALKERGYATALVGKWHLGASNEVGPRRQGFDYFYGYLHGQVDQYRHYSKTDFPIWQRNERLIKDKGHATDLFARESARFIRRQRKRPFFLCLSFSVPHYPVQDEPKWIQMYEKTIPDKDRRGYAAMVSHMDDAIGKLLETLKSAGVADHTLVLFISDNGGQKDWQDTLYGGRHGPYQRLGDNRPLRGWKGQLYEGGVRAVAVAYWPGKLKPGKLSGVAHAFDVYPTVLSLTEKPAAASLRLDGISIWAALSGQAKLPRRSFHWNVGSHTALLDGDWKLIRRERGELRAGERPVELYHLADDPLEQRNLAREAAPTVRRLSRALDQQLAEDASQGQ